MAAPEAIFLLSRAEARDAGNGRRRPSEEKDRARDRPGSRAALDQGTRGAYRASQGGDRPAASDHRQQAGLAQCRRPVLQEVELRNLDPELSPALALNTAPATKGPKYLKS